MNKPCLLIDTSDKLQRAVADMDDSTVLAIDTEYDSFHYFHAKLCLIQIGAGQATYLFDPLEKLDLAFLGRYFQDPHLVKILHAADNDIRLLKRDYGFVFVNIFDTHRAAHLLGFQQLSLEKMLNQFLQVELPKSKKIQRSRWDRRPLSAEQLQYAAQDVMYLPALYQEQLTQLRQRGLAEAARESFAKIASAGWEEKTINKRGYTKIAGYYSLNQQQKETLKKLYLWRYERAREENRAVFMFMPDKILADLVQSGAAWRDVLPVEKARLYGDELERIITGH